MSSSIRSIFVVVPLLLAGCWKDAETQIEECFLQHRDANTCAEYLETVAPEDFRAYANETVAMFMVTDYAYLRNYREAKSSGLLETMSTFAATEEQRQRLDYLESVDAFVSRYGVDFDLLHQLAVKQDSATYDKVFRTLDRPKPFVCELRTVMANHIDDPDFAGAGLTSRIYREYDGTIKNIDVEEDRATAELWINGGAIRAPQEFGNLQFVRVNGNWRIVVSYEPAISF